MRGRTETWYVLAACVLVAMLASACSSASPAPEDTSSAATETAAQAAPSLEPTQGPKDYDIPADAADVSNPIPADEASVTRGEEIYMGTCVDCHGEGGRGDGPAAVRQNPKPADFNAEFVKNLTDGELFYIITNGVEGTGMMSWAVYDEDKRWHLVNYIRSLQE